jgi:peptidoglycan/xylan/chitin deacetylase (PgdA/CDA1 family)
MYKSREESRKALPIIIDRLRKQGYKFLSVSELLRKKELERTVKKG